MMCLMTLGKPRGYMSLLKSRTLPTILFRLNSFLCVTGFPSTRFIKFANDWNSVLSTSVDSRVSSKVLEICINQLLKLLNTEKMKMIITLIDVIKMSSISDEHREAIQQTVVALEELPLFQMVKRCVPDEVTNDGESVEETEPAIRLQDCHYISMLLLIWPYNKDKDKYGRTLEEMVKDQLEKSKSELLQNEVRLIRQQMISVLDYAVIYSHCPCQEKVNGLASQESLPPIAT